MRLHSHEDIPGVADVTGPSTTSATIPVATEPTEADRLDQAFALLVGEFQSQLTDEVVMAVLLDCEGDGKEAQRQLLLQTTLTSNSSNSNSNSNSNTDGTSISGFIGRTSRGGGSVRKAAKRRSLHRPQGKQEGYAMRLSDYLIGSSISGSTTSLRDDHSSGNDRSGGPCSMDSNSSSGLCSNHVGVQGKDPTDMGDYRDAMQLLLFNRQQQHQLEQQQLHQLHQPPMQLTSATLEHHLPCEMTTDILPSHEAETLLQVMRDEADNWQPLPVVMFDKQVQSPHTTCLYIDEDRLGNTPFFYNGTRSTPQNWPSAVQAAAAIVAAAVNAAYVRTTNPRTRSSAELQGPWLPDMAVANSYPTRSNAVGLHSDKLTYIGPRPVIASLTLGATRTFRVRRLAQLSSSGQTLQAAQTFDILLPHNSLLIMFPPMQECFKHEVPPVAASLVRTTGTLIPHPLCGDMRINLTFRMSRPDIIAQIPLCNCPAPSEMRVVIKKPGSLGRYFWMCGGGVMQSIKAKEVRQCGFFKWFD
ncbi:hypothetical protein BASA50_002293 [Batrachochytrium salamandrivorans]|uniref:Fe2OG dioxygenase domain-containing protein n=1 Tax=Batrachochytrium salamandrivorans TaxID=1357716 RepID=A0ABQ8FLS5_9FUNG|nr:hypothetical protein BASA50_002293 [Batrachochytrium salamandrivorans]KAH9270761.1 hypothetical protein BASA83_007123 [Batrachochytrium salamandrivorans]KAJ1344674.1 hypothetical protein BSLG_000197 [Batrachochytrium salamandrivorans]